MPNREQRRHPKKTESPPATPGRMREPDHPHDTIDPRAKSSGHGKKTADKWNQ